MLEESVNSQFDSPGFVLVASRFRIPGPRGLGAVHQLLSFTPRAVPEHVKQIHKEKEEERQDRKQNNRRPFSPLQWGIPPEES